VSWIPASSVFGRHRARTSDANRWLLEMDLVGTIDKLAIRIPKRTELARGVKSMLRTRHDASRHRNKHYRAVRDLQVFGLRSVLYLHQWKTGNHKVQLVGSGSMSFSEILSEIRRTFDLDPLQAEVMRLDLAVDVFGYSVERFRHNTWIKRKRSTSEYGTWSSLRKRVETLYFGQGANVFCVYDKTAERQIEYRRLIRRSGNEPIPRFEDLYGHSEREIVTRLERRYGDGKIPATIRTLEGVQKNAADLNPFEPLRFSPIIISEESINRLPADAFLKAQGLLRLTERLGLHEARRLLNKKTFRNTNRLFSQFQKLIDSDQTLRPPDLHSLYKEATSQQFSR
jgi:hypothetical protein